MNARQPPAPVTGWRRWGAYLALTLVFAIVCGLLSWWQWSRRDEVAAKIAVIERNYDAEPRPLADVFDRLDSWDEDDEWAPVVLRGEYQSEDQILVRNRVRGGQAGFEQLVPLRLEDGRLFVVDRGWLHLSDAADATPETVPEPPTGEVTVVVRLRPAEPTLPGRTAPDGQLPSIDVPEVITLSGGSGYTAAYGLLVSEDPPAAERPLPSVRPAENEGPHLSYALQWIAFGVLAFIGLIWAWRRERRIAALPVAEQAAARAPKRHHADAEAEDAILDAQGR